MTGTLVRRELQDGVAVLTMSHPRRLNGWTAPMLSALQDALRKANLDDSVSAIVLTGEGRYYSAGVNLGGTLTLGHPRRLHAFIVEHNQALFDAFLAVDKPIVAAINGPAIGAPVTSATLCDAIVAAEAATFSTPFHRLGVTPEGCSSLLFPKLLGEAGAQRMLGPEGWVPTAKEALDAGLITEVVAPDALVARAVALALERVDQGRSFRAGLTRQALQDVNARESRELADAFLSPPFLKGQMRFLWKKKKRGPAAMFAALWLTRPAWALLL